MLIYHKNIHQNRELKIIIFFIISIQAISLPKLFHSTLRIISGTAFGLRLAQELNQQYDESGTS